METALRLSRVTSSTDTGYGYPSLSWTSLRPVVGTNPPRTHGSAAGDAAVQVASSIAVAGQGSSASTRRQYASIFRAFGDWLALQLGRPPVVDGLDPDAIAAYARHLATGERPAAPATARVYLSMVRALGRDLGREGPGGGRRIGQ